MHSDHLMKSCMDEESGASVKKSRANAGHVAERQRERDFALEANRDFQEFAAL